MSPIRPTLRLAATLAAVSLSSMALAQTPPADALLARNLAATCANCHGTNGRAQGDMKPLAGWPADGMVAVLTAYKTGAMTGTIMHQIAKGYTDDQIRLIAQYFAAQTPAKP
ncbi:MAG: c-type cytochrome [Inhella sp.]|jgi:sulfide dehydrogenase cytochrome subunit|uniref:c-type cytochrome n=1 Tax=Inhella sp. TaxID=1921806 RepID=UPI0022C9A0C7|nr:c-type cytochrome [Inhella sp.]MCZ8235985.1 c-type cytochrome [Inhella sp.]